VRGFVRETEEVVYLADRIGEWTATGDNEKRHTSAGVGDLCQHGLEVLDAGKQPTAHSNNDC
jgi:hypothetical protein